ncbi:MAG: hypothetical protein KatS3mg059_0813 [Thermomicrobiales bacterium]|nr:MAG: hypothetical protein KatS3mg059_0813 [Thermomicrobiales bacterium]
MTHVHEGLRIPDGDKVHFEDAGGCGDGVPRVAAAVGANNNVCMPGQGIGQLPLTLVTPLTPHNDCGWHRMFPKSSFRSSKLAYGALRSGWM